jgi:predicted nuclease of restriction endonuclease-like (RecB) superfamily
MPDKLSSIPAGYVEWVAGLRERIDAARRRAVLAVNAEQTALYHSIGRELLERQTTEGWGAQVVDQLARDLSAAFPEMRGFSKRNLWYMRRFAERYPEAEIVQQPAAQLPWFHIVTIITKVPDRPACDWYAAAAAAAGWSRSVLKSQIEGRLHLRQGAAVTNFSHRLPMAEAATAQAILKDPYHFDFLGLGEEAHERDIESGLVRHVTRFLLELGSGFSFVGRQVRLDVAGDEFFIDLLFYQYRLKCFVVVELKARDFEPGDAGQLNFYLAAVDAQMKGPDDKASIGLLLCRRQNRLVAEYALSGVDKPIGVAEYRLVRELPTELETSLPRIEELEAELSRDLDTPLPETP